jgi:hypothetical protein
MATILKYNGPKSGDQVIEFYIKDQPASYTIDQLKEGVELSKENYSNSDVDGIKIKVTAVNPNQYFRIDDLSQGNMYCDPIDESTEYIDGEEQSVCTQFWASNVVNGGLSRD